MCFVLYCVLHALLCVLYLNVYHKMCCVLEALLCVLHLNVHHKLCCVLEQGSMECVICMNPVDVTCPSGRMVAPCSHCFHTACLQRWMDVKMECPTCRRPLPQP